MSVQPNLPITIRVQKLLALAKEEANRLGHEYVGTEHLLLGLIKEGTGVGSNILKNLLGDDLRKVRSKIEGIVKPGPTPRETGSKTTLTPRAEKVMEYALEEACEFGFNYIGTEHVLLGLLREQEGTAAQVLMSFELKLQEVREELLALVGHMCHQDEPPSSTLVLHIDPYEVATDMVVKQTEELPDDPAGRAEALALLSNCANSLAAQLGRITPRLVRLTSPTPKK